MRNRIRYHRKRLGLTLVELAARVGTTAQTLSRLETESIAVSTDWLARIAGALGLAAGDLLEDGQAAEIGFAGRVGEGGLVAAGRHDEPLFRLAVPAADPMAVTLAVPLGPYAAGETLVCDRLEKADLPAGLALDCLVGLPDGRTLLRRVVKGQREGLTLIALDPCGEVRHGQKPRWLARVVMRVRMV